MDAWKIRARIEKAQAVKETASRRVIVAYLERRGGWWHAFPANEATGSGVPDILGCYRGFFCGIETKNRNKKYAVQDIQHHTHKSIIAAGGALCVPYTIDDVKEFLDALDLRALHPSEMAER